MKKSIFRRPRPQPLSYLIAPLTLAAVAQPLQAEPVSLFDGKSLNGWESTEGVWRVEDGAITAGSHSKNFPRNEFISTEKSYANFELTLKIKCSAGRSC